MIRAKCVNGGRLSFGKLAWVHALEDGTVFAKYDDDQFEYTYHVDEFEPVRPSWSANAATIRHPITPMVSELIFDALAGHPTIANKVCELSAWGFNGERLVAAAVALAGDDCEDIMRPFWDEEAKEYRGVYKGETFTEVRGRVVALERQDGTVVKASYRWANANCSFLADIKDFDPEAARVSSSAWGDVLMYIGSDQRLKGKTALVRPHEQAGFVLAQFDDPDTGLGLGWHPFSVDWFGPVVTPAQVTERVAEELNEAVIAKVKAMSPPCPECKGTGEYVGLFETMPCSLCGDA